MKKKIVLIILVFSILLNISCQKKEVKKCDTKKMSKLYQTEDGLNSFRFNLPDTLYTGKEYVGEILYKGVFDTIVPDLMKKNPYGDRFINFYATKTNRGNILDDDLKSEFKLDTFSTYQSNRIPLKKIKFDKEGIFYLDGFIEDELFLKAKDTSEVRLISKTYRAKHKFIVIDSIN